MEFFDSIIARRKERPVKVAFTEAADERVLRAARYLADKRLAEPLLLGGPYEVRDYAAQAGVPSKGLKIIHPLHDDRFEEYAGQLKDLYKRSDVTLFDSREWLKSPLVFGAMLLRDKAVDMCISGNRRNSAEVLQTALRLIGAREANIPVSGFYLMAGKNGQPLYAFADCTVIPRPTAEQLAQIAVLTAHNFNRLTGRQPKVAMLSFSTAGSAVHEMTEKMKQAAQLARRLNPNLTVDGEIQFDAAVVTQVAEKKAPQSPLQGQANVFIFPSLSAANIGYKLAEQLAGFRAIGAFIQGLKQPLHLLSRGCRVQTIIDVALVGKEVR